MPHLQTPLLQMTVFQMLVTVASGHWLVNLKISTLNFSTLKLKTSRLNCLRSKNISSTIIKKKILENGVSPDTRKKKLRRLIEAKDLVKGAPKEVKAGVPKKEAEEIKAKLEAAGAKVELK